MRRATLFGFLRVKTLQYFYPRSPCGERLRRILIWQDQNYHFYPRSPCGERLDKQIAQLTEQAFLSTLSLRRATTQMQAAFKGPEISIHALLAESDGHTHYMGVYEQISIHALLAESDSSACCGVRRKYNFYPRSPCGERPLRYSEQSAPPNISIHALLAESDNRYGRPIDVQFVFLSTLSLRRATSLTTYLDTSSIISIHALLAESDPPFVT